MRVVVDTNVLVSAALKESSCPAGVVRWLGRHGGLLKSRATEDELSAVLQRPRIASKITPPFVNGIRRLFAAAELVTITGRVAACRDPKDDKFLELAVNGEADLLVLDTFRAIPILPPAAFLRSAAP